jgi:hypothetical protein
MKKERIRIVWQPCWWVSLGDWHTSQVLVSNDGRWEIYDDHRGRIRRKGKAASVMAAKEAALGAYAHCAEWLRLSEWKQGKFDADVRWNRRSFDWMARRVIDSPRCVVRTGQAGSLRAAQRECEKGIRELSLLAMDEARAECKK